MSIPPAAEQLRGAPRPAPSPGGTRREAFGAVEWGLLTGIALIWGSSFLWIAIGLEAFSPPVIALIRVTLGALALAVVPRSRRPVEREDRLRIAVLGVIWMGGPLLLFPYAEESVSSAVAGMINGGVPLTSAVAATIMFRRLPGRSQLAGLAVGFVGITLITLPSLLDGAAATVLGVAYLLLAIALYGVATNIAGPLQQKYGALPVLLRAQLAAFVFIVPFAVLDWGDTHWELGPALAMIPLGILGTGLAFVGMTTLVGRVGGPRGSVAIYFVPVVAILLGVLANNESVAFISIIGTALVLVGAWLTSRAER